MIYDYPGFGRSSGEASEPGMYEAASSALALLASRDDVDPSRVVLHGHSLGSAATFALASRAMRGQVLATRDGIEVEVRPAAVVSENAWCSIEEMIRDGTFLDLPGELLSRLRFDNCSRIAELRGVPVMLLHGARDRVVPVRQLALLEGRAAAPRSCISCRTRRTSTSPSWASRARRSLLRPACRVPPSSTRAG